MIRVQNLKNQMSTCLTHVIGQKHIKAAVDSVLNNFKAKTASHVKKKEYINTNHFYLFSFFFLKKEKKT